jgi:ferredoxin
VVLASINESGKYFTHPSNFLPEVDPDSCTGCGNCDDSCHVHAITIHEEANGTPVVSVNSERCIGCGVCASTCPADAVNMIRRQTTHVPPKTIKEKFMRIAREKGRI